MQVFARYPNYPTCAPAPNQIAYFFFLSQIRVCWCRSGLWLFEPGVVGDGWWLCPAVPQSEVSAHFGEVYGDEDESVDEVVVEEGVVLGPQCC